MVSCVAQRSASMHVQLTLEMAPVSVGLGAVVLAPNKRFIVEIRRTTAFGPIGYFTDRCFYSLRTTLVKEASGGRSDDSRKRGAKVARSLQGSNNLWRPTAGLETVTTAITTTADDGISIEAGRQARQSGWKPVQRSDVKLQEARKLQTACIQRSSKAAQQGRTWRIVAIEKPGRHHS
jgi:hypothetical protein